MDKDGIERVPVRDMEPIDLTFSAAVMMLEQGFAVEAGATAMHRLIIIHANLIARILQHYEGYDRALILQDVQKVITKLLAEHDANRAPANDGKKKKGSQAPRPDF